MTRKEAAGVIKFEKACVLRQDTPRCNRDCKKCDLLLPTEDVLTAYDMAIKALEQQPCEDTISRQAAIDATWFEPSYTDPLNVLTEVRDRLKALPSAQPELRWIPCSERMPEEYGEYRITWVTSYAPSKRFIGDSEYEVTSVWDEERKDFKGEWLLDEYIKHCPDVKVIAWKPLEEPYQAERRTDE